METTVLWLISLAVVTLLMGCCLIYALRQVSVLRGMISSLGKRLEGVKDQHYNTSETLRTALIDKKEKQVELTTITSKVHTLESDMQKQNRRIADVSSKQLELPKIVDSIMEVKTKVDEAHQRALRDREEARERQNERDRMPVNLEQILPATSTSNSLTSAYKRSTREAQADFLPPAFIAFEVITVPDKLIHNKIYKRRLLSTSLSERGILVTLASPADATGRVASTERVIEVERLAVIILHAESLTHMANQECMLVELKTKMGSTESTRLHSPLAIRPRTPQGLVTRESFTQIEGTSLLIPLCPELDEWVGFLESNGASDKVRKKGTVVSPTSYVSL